MAARSAPCSRPSSSHRSSLHCGSSLSERHWAGRHLGCDPDRPGEHDEYPSLHGGLEGKIMRLEVADFQPSFSFMHRLSPDCNRSSVETLHSGGTVYRVAMKTVFEGEGCQGPGRRRSPGIEPGCGSAITGRSRRGEAITDRAASTVIEVTAEVGRGDSIFIRGRGGGLRWDRGWRLACTGPEHWIWWASGLHEDIEFQLLLNDQVWARGQWSGREEELVAGGGQGTHAWEGFAP